ncbi:MAG: methyltransferase domain-containing protein [Thermoproteota archaeon]|nr:methyltransferase domain-containing protein [Thermoproteota archaeon]
MKQPYQKNPMNDEDNNNYSWDAWTYDKVSSNVQLEWGRKLLDKRRWIGNEIVMDAGAGSGNLTKILADKVPQGYIYAVDADSNMVQQAKSNLSRCRNVQVMQSSMDKVNLPTELDVIFSNAALHWVLDQEGVFLHFWRLLKPNGELLIDYGGHGNLERPLSILFKIMRSEQFREHFANWKQSWYFPRPDETERLLQKVGFKEIQVDLSSQITPFPDRQSFATFVRTVIMKPFLGHLPDANRKEQFVDIFLNEFEGHGWPWSLEFMRLTISARKILT